MAAGYYDLYIEQGATFYQEVVWKDSAGEVIDLTDYTARMQIRKTKQATTPLISLTTENDRITIEAAEGKVILEIAATDTAEFSQFCGVYDLELISSTGFVTRLMEGAVTISREVTR